MKLADLDRMPGEGLVDGLIWAGKRKEDDL